MLFEIISFFFSPFFAIFDPFFSRITGALTSKKTQRAAVKSIFIGFVTVTLLAIALFSYLGFYMLYIPKIAHVRPIYLQYDKVPNLITAEIDFVEGGKYRSILTAEQSYDISIDLYVPVSETNIELGNFMMHLVLTDLGNQTVIESYRPCILSYQSNLLRKVSTIWKLVPLVLGFIKEDQRLKISMIENMIESSENPVTKAFLSISNKQLNTYNAQIRLDAHFRGLRYFMYYHQFSTAFAFISLFLFWEIFASVLAWRLLVSWLQNNMQDFNVPIKNISPIENVGGSGIDTSNGQDKQEEEDEEEDEDDDDVTVDGDKWLKVPRNSTLSDVRNEEENNGELTESDYDTSRPESVISPTSELTNFPNDYTSQQDGEYEDASTNDEYVDDNEEEEEDNENENDNNNIINDNEQNKGGNITSSATSSSDESDEKEESIIGSSSTGRTTAATIGSNARVYRRNVGGGGNETNEQ
ncbi:hypothetical protein Glove_126g30 [Diversispora epigaea]|uniref:Seipin n=1 Tax=Diversispora epigaea TaxID=1348612 RepID=A0A397J755_9GLOM|nr:hypothetical protein Glove_126g30 [Diversispora epigaea]